MNNQSALRFYVTLSMLIAVTGFLTEPAYMTHITSRYIPALADINRGHDGLLSLICSAIWLITFFLGIIIFKKRGLWTLVGLPFAAFLPLVILMFMLACATGGGCL